MRETASLRTDWCILLAVIVGLLAGFLSLLFLHANRGTAATLPTDFENRMVASVDSPVALAFTPDDRMLVATQPGQLRVYKNGQLLQTPALDLSGKICTGKERGLLGVAVDPNFATNHYVYLYYTHNKFGSCPLRETTNPNNPVNRVSRFVMSGDTVDPASERVLIDNIPSPDGAHTAGDVKFGKDGYLYVSVGDGMCDYAGDSGCAGQNDASRDPHVLLGKILRITRHGGIPATNPYQGTDSARCGVPEANGRTEAGKKCQETFSSGLRNPFRMAFDPDASGTRFFVNDVGQNAWEEIDRGEAGADYAWNLCEGNHDNPDRSGSVNCSAAPYTPPIHDYSHGTGCSSITGGAFVPNGLWPASYDDSYLYGDYVCGKIFELTPKDGGGFTRSEFASGLGEGGPIAMTFGPHGSSHALYYTTYANGGEVHRITYAKGANRAPYAAVSASPSYGDVPLEVNFDGSGSSDPDFGDAVSTYLWDFGDGSAAVETTTPTASHTYAGAGTYTATLTVRDTSGAQGTATVRVDAGNAPPEPSIVSPAQEKLFAVGEKIVLRGSATDPQDGQLSDGALSWQVLQHHAGDHTHPFLPPTSGNDIEITTPPPEDIHSTYPEENYLEVRLTATDSRGLSKTVTQKLAPNAVDVTFESRPAGLELRVNGHTFYAARTVTSWEGYRLDVSAPSPQRLSGSTYTFASWSDGGAQSHDIVTGAQPGDYTATFKACTMTGTSANDVLEGTSNVDVICGLGGNDTIKGLGGNDILKGDNGTDKLYGGGGNDSLDGGNATDTAHFSSSVAAITASLIDGNADGEGSDTMSSIENLVGSSKNDALTGSVGNNSINGGSGADTLNGLDGADKLYGRGGNDTEHGGLGNDSVVGSGGADDLFGEEGDDSLNSVDNTAGDDVDGGPDIDTCTTDAVERSIVSCEP